MLTLLAGRRRCYERPAGWKPQLSSWQPRWPFSATCLILQRPCWPFSAPRY